jgi:hypothetical protein
MRIITATVIGGQVVVEGGPLNEGAVVTILAPDEGTFTLSDKDEAALLESIAEADRGELVDADDLLNKLQ